MTCDLPGCGKPRLAGRAWCWGHRCYWEQHTPTPEQRRRRVAELQGRPLSELAAICDQIIATREMPPLGVQRLWRDMRRADTMTEAA